MAKIYCPGCKQLLEHDRGHLPLHMTDIQRGQLVTGSKVCEYSNKKVVTECASVEYTYECPDCGCETSTKLTEDYPGAFTEGIKPWIELNCIGCTIPHDGYYCSNAGCGLEVVEKSNEFYRVSDIGGNHLPVFEADGKTRPMHRDFDNEADAQAFHDSLPQPVSTQANDPSWVSSYTVDAMPPGWYSRDESSECRALLSDPKAVVMNGGDTRHQGEFLREFHKRVRVTDGHVIDEEPEPGEDLLEIAPASGELLICECCQLARTELPYEHQYDDGRSQVYCQECFDAGCNDECVVRSQAREKARQSQRQPGQVQGYPRRQQAPIPSIPPAAFAALDDEITDAAARKFLASVGLDPAINPTACTEAIAKQYQIPIPDAQDLVAELA